MAWGEDREEAATEPVQSDGLPECMRNALKEARKGTPRFLFRGFSEKSGGGESAELNTEQGIKPHAFLKGAACRPHVSIEAYSPAELSDALTDHLHGEHLPTELSSWAFTMLRSIYFGKYHGGRSIRLSVIDTHKLDRVVHAYHVPRFQNIFDILLADNSVPDMFKPEYVANFDYPHEYLMHGKIKGHGFYTTPMSKDQDELYRPVYGPVDERCEQELEQFVLTRCDNGPLKHWEVKVAMTKAHDFNLFHDKKRELFVFLVVHFLAARVSRTRRTWYQGEPETILSTMLPIAKVPGTFMREDWIMLNVVDCDGFPECSMTVAMLRALTYRRFGENAIRGMRKIDPELEHAEPCPKFETPGDVTTMISSSIGVYDRRESEEYGWV